MVAPKKVLDQWINEATSAFPNYFLDRTVKLGVHIKKDYEEGLEADLSKSCLVCVNYETLQRFFPYIEGANLDTILLDESHYIKNAKAKRTQFLLKHKDLFKHRLLLSGTPIKNRVNEFVTQLEFLGVEDAETMVDTTAGALWNKLWEGNIYLRRNITAEFPHLRFKDPAIFNVNDAPESLRGFEDGFEIKKVNIKEKLTETALFKAPVSARCGATLVEHSDGDKVIIFTERIICAELIFQNLSEQYPGTGALLHHGNIPIKEREITLEEFKDPGSGSQILVSTQPSLGIGLNLQCANRVIFNDLPWSPADLQQAAGRVKRLNQQKDVFEYWMIADTDFDGNLMEILKVKLNLIQHFSEGKNVSEEDQKWMTKPVSYKEIIHGIGYEDTPKKS